MLAILFICLVVFAAVSIPIGIAMGLGTLICLIFATNIDPVMIAQNAFAGIDIFLNNTEIDNRNVDREQLYQDIFVFLSQIRGVSAIYSAEQLPH